MPGVNEDRDRQVVPLWRSFETTIRRGELAPLTTARGDRFSDEMLSGLLDDYKAFPTPSVASDLVSAAFTLGRYSIAKDAARFILSSDSGTPAARSIAAMFLDKTELFPGVITEAETADISTLLDHLHGGVRQIRMKLRAYPRNPVLWMNLARLYTSLGHQEKAKQAMRIALAMAPQNRFVLRAASRFYLHLGWADHAHWLLAKAPNIKSDPWVLAAEIATAAASHNTSRFVKTGRRILELQRQPPFHLSELASALGTLESLAGNFKAAKNLINFSLQQPAENSIAQAAWISRRINATLVTGTSPTESFEANAWFASKAGKWKLALEQAERWQTDQPFSSRPAMFGSHLASAVAEDYDLAVAFAKQGILSNPDDFPLQNNLAFSFAMRGDLAEAQKVMRKINIKGLSNVERIFFDATNGLIAFRSGDPEAGRVLYRAAIDLGNRIGNGSQKIARIYYALEELRIQSAEAETTRLHALNEATTLTEHWQVALVERLKRYKAGLKVARPGSQGQPPAPSGERAVADRRETLW